MAKLYGLTELAADELDALILAEYPYPIAVNYRRMLETTDWDRCTRQCVNVFEYSLRAVTLILLNQYLIPDADKVRDIELDRKLYQHLAGASVGRWSEFLFLVLRAYRGRRDLFFVPELYDLYWDMSQEPNRPRKGLRDPFERLVQIRNDLAHRLTPNTDADWKTLGAEVLDLLRKVLGYFSFLQYYDLICIVAKQGEGYEYERYTGREITGHCEPLQGNGGLHEGWFYLRRDDKAVLNLHPLFVLWPNSPQTLPEGTERDAAVFERLLKETVEYVAPVARKYFQSDDAELLAQFRELIYTNLEHIKLGQAQTALSWDSLRQAAGKLTQDKTGAIQVRYERALYLQRNEAFRKFRDFLASDKACFVLTGNSGVGKSNFVLSLADELAQRDDVCLLIYNAARLEIPKTAVQTITQDLGRYLSLGRTAGQDLLAEIDRDEPMAGRQLIVVFDAVNENDDPRALLQKIDQLVGDKHYPWLKVLITSRPQSWWNMKRGLRLAEERYYQDQDSDTLWVELREFTVRLEPFARQELPQVYERYRQTFQLQTPYTELSIQLRQALQDPLILRLVAESYTGQTIPDHIQVGEIYGKYIATLQKSGRLYPEDLILLERELMPLMIFAGHYEQQVTAQQINAARTSDGRPLWELIFSEDLLSNGQRVNASFDRLVDAGILVKPAPGLDYSIIFNYERFYEYFAGRQLLRLLHEPRVSPPRWSDIENKPFVWDAVVQALVVTSHDGDFTWVEEFIATPSTAARGILTQALIQAGHAEYRRVLPLLDALWHQHVASKSPRGRLRSLIGIQINRDQFPDSSVDLDVAAALFEVACGLRHEPLLLKGASETLSVVRQLAVRRIYLLWIQNQEKTVSIIEHLFESVAKSRYDSQLDVLTSCAEITALILGTPGLDQISASWLDTCWASQRRRLQSQAGARRRLLPLKTLPDQIVDLVSTGSFFAFRGTLHLEDARRFSELIAVLDQDPRRLEGLHGRLKNWYLEGDACFRDWCDLFFALREDSSPGSLLQTMSDLFFGGDAEVKARILRLLYLFLPSSDPASHIVVEMLAELMHSVFADPSGLDTLRQAANPADSALTAYLATSNQVPHVAGFAHLRALVDQTIARSEWQAFQFVLDCIVAAVVRDSKSMEVLRLVLHCHQSEAVDLVARCLAEVRFLRAGALDDFIAETEISPELQNRLDFYQFISILPAVTTITSPLLATAFQWNSMSTAGRELLSSKLPAMSGPAELLAWSLAGPIDATIYGANATVQVHPLLADDADDFLLLALFAQPESFRGFFQAYYSLSKTGSNDSLRRLAEATRYLSTAYPAIPGILLGEDAWRAASIAGMLEFARRLDSKLFSVESDVHGFNKWLRETMHLPHLPPVFADGIDVMLTQVSVQLQSLQGYETALEDAIRIEILETTVQAIDDFLSTQLPDLPVLQRTIANAILSNCRRIAQNEIASLPNWPAWEVRIVAELAHTGRVEPGDLSFVPADLRTGVLQRFAEKYSRHDLDLEPDAVLLGPNARAVGDALLSMWQLLFETDGQSTEEFLAGAANLVQQLGSALSIKHGIWRRSGEWLAGYLDTHGLFRDTKLPRRLPVIFGRTLDSANMGSLHNLLASLETEMASSKVVLLCLPVSSEQHVDIQALLDADEWIRRVHVFDVIAMGPLELFGWLVSTDRERSLKRLILAHVNLVTTSPFSAEGPTPNDMFFGREQELREISDHADERSYVVIAGRRMGKTSLLYRLHRAHLPAAGFRSIYFDCSTARTYDALFAARPPSWQPGPPPDAPATFGELFAHVPDDKHLVLLLDEADHLVPAERATGWRLFSELRALTVTEPIQVILSGSRALREALRDPDSPLFNFVKLVPLSPLSLQDTRELVTRPMRQIEVELSDEAEITGRIWEFTSGHPSVVQRLCDRLIRRINLVGSRRITPEDVDAVIDDLDFQRDDFLDTFLEQATPLEKVVCLLMADDRSIHDVDLLRQVLIDRCGLHLRDLELDQALERLVHLRSILRRTAGSYEFAVEAFPRVLARTMTLDRMLRSLAEEYQEVET